MPLGEMHWMSPLEYDDLLEFDDHRCDILLLGLRFFSHLAEFWFYFLFSCLYQGLTTLTLIVPFCSNVF